MRVTNQTAGALPSEVELIEKSERDNFAFWRAFADRPGGTSGVDDGVSWYRSGIAIENYNGLIGGTVDIDAAIARAQAWGLPCRWLFSDASIPDGFEAALAARGCTPAGEYPGMVAPVSAIGVPRVEGLTVTTVRDAGTFATWMDVFADGFGFAGTAALARVTDAHEWPCVYDPHRTYLLLHLDGEPVATGLLHDRTGVAGVYGIAVRQAWRGRGLGRAATQATVQEGARRGFSLALLQATEQGLPVYDRLGFRTVCVFKTWTITP